MISQHGLERHRAEAPRRRRAAVLAAFFLLAACAQPEGRRPGLLAAPPSEEIRARLGTIGLVVAEFAPERDFDTPGGAGRGAAIGAVASTEALASIYLAPLAPLFWLGGAVYGAVAGPASADVAAAEASFEEVLSDPHFAAELRSAVLETARERAGRTLIALSDGGSAGATDKPDISGPTGQGVDSLLELAVRTVGLAGAWDVDPPLVFYMSMQARLVRSDGGAELHVLDITHRGSIRRFTEWGGDGARAFRDEVRAGLRMLAERIVDEVFLLYLPIAASVKHPAAPPAP